MEFISLFGKCTISRDAAVIDKLYGRMDDSWFDGKTDPNITAICFEPSDGNYWDTKHGALVSLLKMGVGMVTGEKQKLGNTGNLNV